MRNRKRIISGIVLIAVYAFFFASTNLFYHSHLIANIKIVHSHPWSASSHSHNSDQLSLISLLDSEMFQDTPEAEAPVVQPLLISCCRKVCSVAVVPSRSVLSFSLRAPPAGC